ncbi:KilA-N domain-containing protein [Salmonella enterica]|uniref:KilA-N domain-containing protein n=1 Tax=Salmonella enterica TaxID=28901 RepID=UPI003AAE42A9
MLTLSDGVSVAQDVKGRFCVNDLHVAAGGERRHEPANWLSLQQTKDLVSEILNTEISVFNSPAMKITPIESVRGRNGGTYVCRELVYAYAMWISPSFHLRVIRAFDAMASNVAPRAEAAPGLDASLEDTRFVVDAQGRFLLLPIYYAAGSLGRHRPVHWMTQPGTRAFFSRMQKRYDFPVCNVIERGLARGTYVARELVFEYAAWVDPALMPAVKEAMRRKPMGIVEWEKIASRRLAQKIAAARPRKPTPPVLPAPPVRPVEPMSLQNIQLAGQVIEFMFDSLNINNDKAKEVIRDLNKMIN